MDETTDEESVDDGLNGANQKMLKTLENEKLDNNSHSNILKHSTEMWANSKQPKQMDARYIQQRDLMNCIAFEKCDDPEKGNEVWSEVRYSDDFDSLSSDTTSDITDVSPQPLSPLPSSSGCSSVIKAEKQIENGKHAVEDKQFVDQRYSSNKQKCSKTVCMSKSSTNAKKEDEGEQALKFLKDALISLDCGSSVKTNSSSSGKQTYPRQKNMTFTREQLRNIDRENMILLRKIQCSRRKNTIDNIAENHSRIASSAINRQKLQRKIEFENSILLQKIQRVKGTTNTMTGLRRF